MTPTARTLAECKKRQWLAQVVERRLPHSFTTVDLFGCIDVVALDGQPGVLGIQACITSDMARREKKIRAECWPKVEQWLRAGNRLVVWGWAKRGKEGKRKLWTLREVEVTA